jgi:hypothetical protein
MIQVKATREGLSAQITASGYRIDGFVPFVALPHKDYLHHIVFIKNPANGLQTVAMVLDIGPWNIDDPYVAAVASGDFTIRPLSEANIKTDGHGNRFIGAPTNGAGIDLGEYVWNKLEMKDNTNVQWKFIW